jgi:hypothetical protein
MTSAAMARDAARKTALSPAGAAGPWTLVLLALVFGALVLSRKPEVLLHAELWGDDGWSWYPDAYNIGAASLLQPVNGYLNSLQRLIGLAVQPFPLTWVPTLFAGVALVVQVLPALFLASVRMAPVWPNIFARLLFALIMIMLPNEIEFYVNLTNAQWNLSLLAFMVLVSAPPAGAAAAVFDTFVLLLSGLSGPFCLLLIPVGLLQLWEDRSTTSLWRMAVLGVTGLTQIGFLLGVPHGGRSTAPLGAGPRMLARVVSLEVLLGAELGFYTIQNVYAASIWQPNAVPLTVAMIGFVLAVVAMVRGSSLVRKAALFASLVFLGALVSPQVSIDVPQWQVMARPPMGNRYYTIPILAWVAVLFTLAADRNRWLRGIGVALLAVLLLWAVPHDWHELPMPRTDFLERARAFEAAPPGTRMEFPIHPPGLSPMVLTKRAP